MDKIYKSLCEEFSTDLILRDTAIIYCPLCTISYSHGRFTFRDAVGTTIHTSITSLPMITHASAYIREVLYELEKN